MLELTVLISGSGSNLQSLINCQKDGQLNGKITQVISSSSKAYGLTRAQEAQIPTKCHELKTYYKGIPKENKEERLQAREVFNKELANLIIFGNVKGEPQSDYKKPNLIVCAGWMLILSPTVLKPLEQNGITIINLHPALPGAFDGTHAIERAWKAGQDGEINQAGIMIHKVITEVDRGQPILVKYLDIIKGETVEDYEERVHKLEHIAIVEATNITLKKLQNNEPI